MDFSNIDIESTAALLAYLRSRGLIAQDAEPCVRSLAGGVSARTVFVGDESGVGIVVKQALGKLRVNDDWFCSPERMHREALGLRLLQPAEPGGAAMTPEFIFEDPANHILAMRAVPEPHENFRSMLLSGEVRLDLCAQFGRMLGAIQATRLGSAPEFAELADQSFFSALRLEPYYLTAAERVPEAAAFLNQLVERTLQRHDVLVHGDFSPKNVLVYQGRLCLLDFEVIHLGDGGFDTGFALSHLLAKAIHLPHRRAELLEGARVFLRAYQAIDGKIAEQYAASAAAHTVGCLLGRVAGRSPLNYLTADQRKFQRQLAVELTRCMIADPLELVEIFASRLSF